MKVGLFVGRNLAMEAIINGMIPEFDAAQGCVVCGKRSVGWIKFRGYCDNAEHKTVAEQKGTV